MRNHKGSRRIVANDIEYRWRATGSDGWINLSIWPANGVGPIVCGTLEYGETWVRHPDGSRSSAGDQIVVTNRIVRRVIEHAMAQHGYDPLTAGAGPDLGRLGQIVELGDAERARRRRDP